MNEYTEPPSNIRDLILRNKDLDLLRTVRYSGVRNEDDMNKRFWTTWETRRKPLTGFEVFCLERRIDEINAKKRCMARDKRELGLIISILEVSLNRLLYSNGAA